jgi:hypothetical protein
LRGSSPRPVCRNRAINEREKLAFYLPQTSKVFTFVVCLLIEINVATGSSVARTHRAVCSLPHRGTEGSPEQKAPQSPRADHSAQTHIARDLFRRIDFRR